MPKPIASVLSVAAFALAMFISFPVFSQDASGKFSPTPSTGTGPEFIADPPFTATLWRDGDPGDRLMLTGRVINVDGAPIAGAVVNIWQADGAGSYHQDAYRGRMATDDAGNYAFRTAVPGSGFGVAHIHMQVTHDGYGAVTTRVEFKGDPGLSEWSSDHAIVLEETRLNEDVVFVGSFDVVMPSR